MRGPKVATRLVSYLLAVVVAAVASTAATASPHPAQQQSAAPPQTAAQEPDQHDDDSSRISDEYIPLLVEGALSRPKPLLELGTPFLGSGHIRRGFSIPGGAVWQPSFLLFGTFRSGLSVTDNDETRRAQWANRLDLFGNLYLTGTERVVFGLRPMDQVVNGARRFTGFVDIEPDAGDMSGWRNEFNFDWDTVTHLFFEGDFQELFPGIDIKDQHALDFGFSVGRQPINFQEGLLINDFVDAVGITRNNLKPSGAVNLRITGLWAWNGINRNTPTSTAATRNLEAERSWAAGVFTETDFRATTMAIDALYVSGGDFVFADDVDVVPNADGELEVAAGDGVYVGVSFVQRMKGINTAFRLVGSAPVGAQPAEDAGLLDPAAAGAVLFLETSWTPHHGHNLFYLNGFWAVEKYRAAALDPLVPGPLARAGILFAGAPVGNFGAALSPTAEEAVGAAFGHQIFFHHGRQQLLLEVGGRYSTRSCGAEELGCRPQSAAAGARYQIAAGRRGVFVFDGYVAYDALRGARTQDHVVRPGGRVELLIKF